MLHTLGSGRYTHSSRIICLLCLSTLLVFSLLHLHLSGFPAHLLGHHHCAGHAPARMPGKGRGKRHDLRGTPIVVTENVQDYREAVPHYVRPADVVLELGSAQGCTTRVIAEYAKEVRRGGVHMAVVAKTDMCPLVAGSRHTCVDVTTRDIC